MRACYDEISAAVNLQGNWQSTNPQEYLQPLPEASMASAQSNLQSLQASMAAAQGNPQEFQQSLQSTSPFPATFNNGFHPHQGRGNQMPNFHWQSRQATWTSSQQPEQQQRGESAWSNPTSQVSQQATMVATMVSQQISLPQTSPSQLWGAP